MFGYVIVNKQEMKFKDFEVYQSYYCGFCQELKKRYGVKGQITVTYDMTFLILLLKGLYEVEDKVDGCKCIAHPFDRHPTRANIFMEYAADINILMTYYQCMDDWEDEKKVWKRGYAGILKRAFGEAAARYPQKAEEISGQMQLLHECEKKNEKNLDIVAGCFGNIMAEIFALKNDEWEEELRKMGFFLGKFIYLMDAYEDIEKDRKKGNFNPFLSMCGENGFDDEVYHILRMMMAECSRAFEKLPVLQNVDILRNILYSGVWCRYEMVKGKRKEQQENA